LPYSYYTLSGIGTRERVQLRLKELPMPDLDLIKQGEQELRDRRGRFVKGRSGNPTRLARGSRESDFRFCS
jgi:hypothetical protein